MNTACRAVTIVNRSEEQARRAIDSWMTANGFSRTSTLDRTPMRGSRDSFIGLTDNQTKRVIEVVLKSHGDLVAVFHHATTI